MTKDRNKSGIPISKITDTIKGKDEFGNDVTLKFKNETIVKDDDGNIIGVMKEWQ